MFGSLSLPLFSSLATPRVPSVRGRLSPIQVILLGALASILLGTGLLMLPIAQRAGVHVRFLDCLFTATSATTVTGLVTVSTHDSYTLFGQCVILVMMQLGGLGYMVIASIIAIMLGLRMGLLARVQFGDGQGVFNLRHALQVTRYVVLGTFIIEGAGMLLLAGRFFFHQHLSLLRALYQGLFYSVSAFCNAGFDLAPKFTGFTDRLLRLDDTLLLIVGVLVLLGGLGISVLIELVLLRRAKRLTLHAKLVLIMTVVLMVVGMALFELFEWANGDTLGGIHSTGHHLVTSWFMSISARSAGFSPVDLSAASPPTLLVLGMLMLIGASPGSTGGGVKTTTAVVIVLAIITLLRRRADIEVFGRRISGEMVRLALSLLVIYLFAALLVVIGISVTEISLKALPAAEAMVRFARLAFEVISAFGAGGMSTGITPTLAPLSRGLIIFAMVLGRFGPLAFVFIFAQAKRPQLHRLPAEPIMAG